MRRLQFFLICLGIMLLGLVKAANPVFQNFTSSNITNNSAEISFEIKVTDPASSGDLYLDYGTTTALGSRILKGSVVGGTLQTVRHFFSNLNPDTTYYWSAKYAETTNSTTTTSAVQSFTTGQPLFVEIPFSDLIQGTGTVSSNPAGINCSTTCTTNFPTGTVVTLTAISSIGSAFSGWSGGGCTGNALTCTVTMEAAKTVRVEFLKLTQRERLQVTRSGGGSVNFTTYQTGVGCLSYARDCTNFFDYGRTVTLTAIADPDARFTAWGDDCEFAGSASTCTLIMNYTNYVTANFEFLPPVQYYLEVSQAGTGGGTGKVSRYVVSD
jgi:hypothetical protein